MHSSFSITSQTPLACVHSTCIGGGGCSERDCNFLFNPRRVRISTRKSEHSIGVEDELQTRSRAPALNDSSNAHLLTTNTRCMCVARYASGKRKLQCDYDDLARRVCRQRRAASMLFCGIVYNQTHSFFLFSSHSYSSPSQSHFNDTHCAFFKYPVFFQVFGVGLSLMFLS